MQIQAPHQVIMFDSQDALSYRGTPKAAWGIWASFSAACLQCWVARGMHAVKGISHTCFWPCHSPRLCHTAFILWQCPAQCNPKSRCVTSLSLPWHTYRKLSSTAVFSGSLDRQLLPLQLPCVILWISKWNYPSDIFHFKSNSTSFPVKTSELFFFFFFHAENDCLW